MNRSLKFAELALCDSCLQYVADCECCECGGFTDDHVTGCDEAQTKPRVSMVVERRVPTQRGLGLDLTIKTPAIVIYIGNATGLESTDNIRMVCSSTIARPKVKP